MRAVVRIRALFAAVEMHVEEGVGRDEKKIHRFQLSTFLRFYVGVRCSFRDRFVFVYRHLAN